MMKEAIISVVSLGAGYLLADNLLRRKYDRLLAEELEATREFYDSRDERIQNAVDAMTVYTGEPDVPQEPFPWDGETEEVKSESPLSKDEDDKPVRVVDNIVSPVERAAELEKAANRVPYNRISTVDEEADAIEVLKKRAYDGGPEGSNSRPPHLITFGVFDANEEGYEQISLSFFAGDGIVLDEGDVVVTPERVEEIIGTDNLNKFGTNTEDPDMDPNVLHIRCEKFNMDFEVVRDMGTHASVVNAR